MHTGEKYNISCVSRQSFYLLSSIHQDFHFHLLQVFEMKNWTVLHELTQEQAHVSV